MTDFDEDIVIARRSLQPQGHPTRGDSLHHLADLLWNRYQHNGCIEDLQEYISLCRTCLELRPSGHPSRPASLMSLAIGLATRFERNGGTQDLEESINLLRSSLELRPSGNPYRSASLMNLANALLTRFEQNGGTQDLEESIDLYRAALALLPSGHPGRSALLMNLANALWTRFKQNGGTQDLEESIEFYRASLELLPSGHPYRSPSLMNLANALNTRYEQNGGAQDLEESIELYRASLELRPSGHPYRSMSLMNLATALNTRYEQNSGTQDLEESIELYRASLEQRPFGHPLRSQTLMNLARTLVVRHTHSTNMHEDLGTAIAMLESGAKHESSPSLDRLAAAFAWTVFSRYYGHPTCLLAYETAINLFEASLDIVPTLSMQHELLTRKEGFPTLAVDAASYAIEHGNLVRAVEFLEQGRALLWSQMRGLRATIEDLAIANNELANSFTEVNSKLEALATSVSSHAHFPASDTATGLSSDSRRFDEMMAQSRRLSEKRKEILDEIRTVPGFEDFQRPTPFRKLQKAAAEGPVIILNHSKYRSDALIILFDRDPIAVPLSADCPKFYSDMVGLRDNLLEERSRSLNSKPEKYDEKLRETLIDLWYFVVSKVVDKLIEIGLPRGSRIWWCPTSILQGLPFHAAGEWRKDEDGIMRYCTHEYICSRTPTLNALIQARSNIKSTPAHSSPLLFVGQMDESLPSVKQEKRVIKKLRICDTYLVGGDATRDEVLKSLNDHIWVHFSCHGSLKPGEPFNSSFKLAKDERLTLLDIVRARLPHAELAFLAACHTAEQTEKSAHDEVLHLAAGVQFCGFRSVIGTMWAMSDEEGPVVAKAFYKHMIAEDGSPEVGFKRSARALHAATTYLRKKRNASLESWVNFVHIGA